MWCILHGSFPYHKIFVRALMNAREQYRSDRSKIRKKDMLCQTVLMTSTLKSSEMLFAKPFFLA